VKRNDYLRRIPAKPTGIYRSRLESRFHERWNAEFPDHPALYEPYRLAVPKGRGSAVKDSKSYLPDFVVPSARMVIEVKPQPHFIAGRQGLDRLVNVMSRMGWLFLCWSGKRDDWRTPWTLLGSPYRWLDYQWGCQAGHRGRSGPTVYEFAGDVNIERCATCGGPTPGWGRASDWIWNTRDGDWKEPPTDYVNWMFNCFCCGHDIYKPKNNGAPMGLPRAESFTAIYSRSLAEWERA
jgi:hypothetical protein